MYHWCLWDHKVCLKTSAQASSLTHLLAIVQHLGSQIFLWPGHKFSLILEDIKVPELLLNPRPLHPDHDFSHQVQDDLKVFLKRGSLCCPRLAATTWPHSALHGCPQLKVGFRVNFILVIITIITIIIITIIIIVIIITIIITITTMFQRELLDLLHGGAPVPERAQADAEDQILPADKWGINCLSV